MSHSTSKTLLETLLKIQLVHWIDPQESVGKVIFPRKKKGGRREQSYINLYDTSHCGGRKRGCSHRVPWKNSLDLLASVAFLVRILLANPPTSLSLSLSHLLHIPQWSIAQSCHRFVTWAMPPPPLLRSPPQRTHTRRDWLQKKGFLYPVPRVHFHFEEILPKYDSFQIIQIYFVVSLMPMILCTPQCI